MLVAQLCPTVCHPMVCSLPASSVHGILQARILEWGAILLSRDLPDLGLPHCRKLLYYLSSYFRIFSFLVLFICCSWAAYFKDPLSFVPVSTGVLSTCSHCLVESYIWVVFWDNVWKVNFNLDVACVKCWCMAKAITIF